MNEQHAEELLIDASFEFDEVGGEVRFVLHLKSSSQSGIRKFGC
jgi:hypothetical protein